MISDDQIEAVFAGPKKRLEPVRAVTDPGPHISDSEIQPEYQEWRKMRLGEVDTHPVALKGLGSGGKAVFETSRGDRWMVKAYHEPLSKEITHYDTGGWAEKTTQELYRAGGIGSLCQTSLVAEPEKPITITKFRKNTKHYDPDLVPSPSVNAILSCDAVKIGMMDFLTNNVDRCSTNFLTKHDPITGIPTGLYAIDHAASFQYLMPNIFGDQTSDHDHDHLNEYIRGDNDWAAFARLQSGTTPYVEHGVRWWKVNGPFVRHAMEASLKHVTDERIKKHIRSNFRARADCLDRLVSNWPGHRDWSEFLPGTPLANLVDAPMQRYA